jgi:ubiquinone biosynthesis protein
MLGRFSHALRFLRAGVVMAREGVFSLIDPEMVPPSARAGLKFMRLIERRGLGKGEASKAGARLASAMTRLGPSYVKFGQFLATRPDIVGVKVAADLGLLQDRMPAFAQSIAREILENNLNAPIEKVFVSFSEPLAAASIAQVHKGVLMDGREVAIKILRPDIRMRFTRDLQAMEYMAQKAEKHVPEAKRMQAVGIVKTLQRSVTLEMDLRLEAAALSELSDNTRQDTDFRVPSPIWEFTTREVMVSEWIDAIPIHDLKALDAGGHDRKRLARIVIQSFLKHAIHDGFFHADMHQGNLMVDAQSRLVAVDGGIMGRLGIKERRFLAEILLGFITRDYTRVAQVHFDAGYVPAHQSVADFAQAIRAVGEPIHDRRADQISMATLLTLLFEITSLFEMKTRTELVMLQKTMVVVEGVARTLDPQLDMWRTADPVVRAWITDNLGPKGRLRNAGAGLVALLNLAHHLPEALSRFVDAKKMPQTNEAASPTAMPSRASRFYAPLNTLALWIIASSLGYILWKVM